jgi:hypothetical protein
VQKSFPKWAKVLPEIKRVQQAQYNLNAYLQELIPMNVDPVNESAGFNFNLYFEHILSKFGLLDLVNDPSTTDPVKVAVTFDGGSISHFPSHMTGGFKLVDKCCIDPKTGLPLFGDSGIDKVQSHLHCFPVKIAFAKDTKALYQVEYQALFALLRDYESEKKFG